MSEFAELPDDFVPVPKWDDHPDRLAEKGRPQPAINFKPKPTLDQMVRALETNPRVTGNDKNLAKNIGKKLRKGRSREVTEAQKEYLEGVYEKQSGTGVAPASAPTDPTAAPPPPVPETREPRPTPQPKNGMPDPEVAWDTYAAAHGKAQAAMQGKSGKDLHDALNALASSHQRELKIVTHVYSDALRRVYPRALSPTGRATRGTCPAFRRASGIARSARRTGGT